MELLREAKMSDHEKISSLMTQLDYPGTEKFMALQLERLLQHPDESIFVYESEGNVVGFMSVHFIPQLALEGDFARISYFAVDENVRGKNIGSLLEAHAVTLAEERYCDRIELHCNFKRVKAHQFYQKQGYEEVPKYFVKSLKK